MAVTVTNQGRSIAGNKRIIYADITFDTSYPTGGEPLTAANLGFGSKVDFLQASNGGGYVFGYDYTNSKIQVYVEEAAAAGGPLLEVADTTNISTVVCRVRAEGS